MLSPQEHFYSDGHAIVYVLSRSSCPEYIHAIYTAHLDRRTISIHKYLPIMHAIITLPLDDTVIISIYQYSHSLLSDI